MGCEHGAAGAGAHPVHPEDHQPTRPSRPDASNNPTPIEPPTAHPATTPDDTGQAELPVPVTVWRTPAHPPQVTLPDGRPGLPAALAYRLLLTYTRPGDTVADLDHDPALRVAAAAAGCSYLDLARPDQLAALAGSTRAAGAVVLRWPRPENEPCNSAHIDLFAACRTALAGHGHAIVALTDPIHGGHAYLDHAAGLLGAARSAGLGYLQHIIAVTAATGGNPFIPHLTPTGIAAAHTAQRTPAAEAARIQIDLLVFVVAPARHG